MFVAPGCVRAAAVHAEHLTGQPEEIADRLLARDGCPPALQRLRAITIAYIRVFARLAVDASVITFDTIATLA